MNGRVLEVSAERVALAILDESVRPNGITIVSCADLTRLYSPMPYARFVERAMRLRDERFPRLGKIDLTSWRSVVTAAAKKAALVTIHVERRDPSVCYIGRPSQMDDLRLTLTTVSPNAEWEPEEPLVVPWRDVTRVDFGGAYEKALELVAGPAPRAPRPR
ncbi:MAG TPA: hypothetical protein VGK67_10615 [Myxococcales bacterium]